MLRVLTIVITYKEVPEKDGLVLQINVGTFG